jgi:hypothetical protein
MAYDDRRVDRLIRRGSTKPLQRAVHPLPDAVQRISDRAEGPVLTRAPDKIEVVVARQEGGTPAASGRDMRSEIARQVAELVALDADKGLLREGEAAAEAPAAGGAAEDQGETSAFQDWYDQLAATGLKDPEIEEIMLQRLRGLRRGLLSLSATRKVGK